MKRTIYFLSKNFWSLYKEKNEHRWNYYRSNNVSSL